jgi:tetratricopeptide (TPR) repeat protein
MMDFEYEDDNDELNRQELDETLRRFRESVRSGNWQNGTPSIESLETVVHYCLETSAFEDAFVFAKMWTERAPYSPDAWHKFGIALSSLGRWTDALEAYSRASSLDPIDTELIINRGIALEQLGRLDDAQPLIDAAVQHDPENVDALFTKALILQRRERYDEALRMFTVIARHEQFQRDALFEMAICREAVEQ